VLIIKPDRFVTHTVVANSLALGVCLVVKSIAAVIPAIAAPILAFTNASNNAYTSLSGVLTIIDYIVVVLSFVFFVINAFALMSKKETVLFGKTAGKIC
jgi:hypothetical protein